MPSSKSSAVATPSNVRPSSVIENATSGWIPTTTVLAPRSAVVSAMPRSVLVAKESITSSAETSMTKASDLLGELVSQSDQVIVGEGGLDAHDEHAALLEDRDRHRGPGSEALGRGCCPLGQRHDLVAEHPFRFFQPALQVADRFYPA